MCDESAYLMMALVFRDISLMIVPFEPMTSDTLSDGHSISPIVTLAGAGAGQGRGRGQGQGQGVWGRVSERAKTRVVWVT